MNKACKMGLRKLVETVGGAEGFLDQLNAVIKETGYPMNPVSLRALRHWTWEGGPPAHAHMWILAASMRAGISRQDAIAAFPGLDAALNLARLVTSEKAAA